MRINIGSGTDGKQGWVNVDLHPLPGVDVVHDLDAFPWPFEDGSAEEILASHVFEHVAKPVEFVLECWRILQPGGGLKIVCPSYESENAFTDPTHVRFVTPKTFDYWCEGEMLNEKLGAQFLGDQYRFKKIRVRKHGGDLWFLMAKLP